jgi:glutamate synthase domain-containing protein 1
VTPSATSSHFPQPRRRPTEPVGLYDPAFEHDSCGVAFVARLNGAASHETLERALTVLENLEHRGATGADPLTGDGAGMLLQLPDEFFRAVVEVELPPAGAYGVAVCFLPREDPERRTELEQILVNAVEAEGQSVICWRDVPMELDSVGVTAREAAPAVRQLVGAAPP